MGCMSRRRLSDRAVRAAEGNERDEIYKKAARPRVLRKNGGLTFRRKRCLSLKRQCRSYARESGGIGTLSRLRYLTAIPPAHTEFANIPSGTTGFAATPQAKHRVSNKRIIANLRDLTVSAQEPYACSCCGVNMDDEKSRACGAVPVARELEAVELCLSRTVSQISQRR